MSDIIAYKFNDEIIDTQSIGDRKNEASPIYFSNSKEALFILRHSCAHLMAHAIKQLYPKAKFFVGPAIEDGFYYDFRVTKEDGTKLNDEDLIKIEDRMKEIAAKRISLVKSYFDKAKIAQIYKDDDLKQEVLSHIEDNTISTYSQDDFEDICRGPHLPDTSFLKYFKLIRVAGAYLGGDETKEMLTRIYGVVFADKKSLDSYVRMIEEAKKRDHRKLGNEMKLFTFDDELGAGLPIWLPNGARLRSKLEKVLFKIHRKRGYEPVRGPEILKSDTWKKSGHYANYKENMYFTHIDEQEYGIKPMNCIGHIKVYQSDVRSYRDLPLKFFEYGVVHRHEKSGVMHGLFRVREFTQDDAHLFCMPSQIKENIIEILDFVKELMNMFDFKYELEISTKPKKAMGDDAIWQTATAALKEALDENHLKYGIDEGGGAFYGPKIDIKITDAIGRKWQCGTVQVDFNLPERFDLSYIDEHNQKQRPVMLHRAILGSFERFIGILIEHTAGELQLFIAPVGVSIIPIRDEHMEYAKEIESKIKELEVDVEILKPTETLNKRIRVAEKAHVPMILVVGDEEVSNKHVALRDRRARTQSQMTLDEYLTFLKEKLNEVFF